MANLQLQKATPVAGVALINGTQTIVSWTAPNDGQLHRVVLFTTRDVTSGETGGAETVSLVAPDGTVGGYTLSGGNAPTGVTSGTTQSWIIKAGTAFTLTQSSALTAGAAIRWAEIWGS